MEGLVQSYIDDAKSKVADGCVFTEDQTRILHEAFDCIGEGLSELIKRQDELNLKLARGIGKAREAIRG